MTRRELFSTIAAAFVAPAAIAAIPKPALTGTIPDCTEAWHAYREDGHMFYVNGRGLMLQNAYSLNLAAIAYQRAYNHFLSLQADTIRLLPPGKIDRA